MHGYLRRRTMHVVTRQERSTRERFAEQYRLKPSDALRTIERAVIGGDWGASGYTTMAQADQLAELARLGPTKTLLDLGAGRGWPGLYLAATTGCAVVLTDVPPEGLRAAMTRARAELLSGRVAAVAASARALPLRPGTFDAVVHTDVLCCLRAKLSVLRASRAVLRPGGTTAFFTIHASTGLDRSRLRRAHRLGPCAVATTAPYGDLLGRAGYVDIVQIDCTAEFGSAARAWLDQYSEHREAMVATLGAAAFEDRQAARRLLVRAIDEGLLRRSLFVASRPGA
jgi:ubiquinone/menaquinone biosynthesis C-methylase UbiE